MAWAFEARCQAVPVKAGWSALSHIAGGAGRYFDHALTDHGLNITQWRRVLGV